jgi:hypothetical protein
MFDPPLSLKGGREGVLHLLEAASGEKREREAADAFRAWVEAEGLILAR